MASSVASLLCALSFATCAASLKTSASHENALPTGTKPDWMHTPEPKYAKLPFSFEGQECPRHCTPDECGHADWGDAEKPFLQVFREQPLINGFCYYAQLGGGWLAHIPALQKSHNLMGQILYYDYTGHRSLGNVSITELRPYHDDQGRDVTLKTRLQPYYGGSIGDIPYYHALGWLQGQGLDATKMSNWTAWQEVARAECQKLKDLGNFDDETFTWRYHSDFNGCWTNRTVYDFRAHAYGKCLLGLEGNMAEMLWAYLGIGCVLPDNYIGHGRECDDYYGTSPYTRYRRRWYR